MTRRAGRPVVEVLGPWLGNKGDALMLDAIVDRLGQRAILAASPEFGLVDPRLAQVRRTNPLMSDARRSLAGGRPGTAARLARNAAALSALPATVAARYGAVPARSVSALLDCSGFAYGDQWSTRRPLERARHLAALKRRGARLVMLPQALGPFEDPAVREAAAMLLGEFDLVCARDAVSAGHARRLLPDLDGVLTVPDITHLVQPAPRRDAVASPRVAVVPNARMLDKTEGETARAYLGFVARVVGDVRAAGLEPCLVLHETNDGGIVAGIIEKVGPLPVIDEDARATKAILASSRFVVSSRFHAIVGALSTATPVIGTSWSHKYRALFDEYEVPELLATAEEPDAVTRARLGGLIDEDANRALRARLTGVAVTKIAAVESMWKRVGALIGTDEAETPVPFPAAAAPVSR